MLKEFSEGQLVVWKDPQDPFIINFQISRHGVGPFKIKAARDVPPDACNCGGDFNDRDHTYLESCPYTGMVLGGIQLGKRIIEAVGHAQWVILEGIGEFSGAWFRPATA